MSTDNPPTELPELPQGEVPKYVFWVRGVFAHNTKKPLVLVTVNGADFSTVMSPDEARDLAMNLLASAEAAEQDAFTMSYLRTKFNFPMRTIARFLEEFREWRTRQHL